MSTAMSSASAGRRGDRVDHLLASSQLAKRTDRRDEVLQPEWDLVLVDEAHHARRKEFGDKARRPNHLLQLLGGHGGRPGLRDRTRCLYLLTATPMQVHPLEVWDLLKLLGLEGRWGASEQNFLRFFEEVRSPFGQRDWSFLVGMMKDFLEVGGQIDPAFADKASQTLGPVTWNRIQTLVDTIKSRAIIQELEPDARQVLDKMVQSPPRLFEHSCGATAAICFTGTGNVASSKNASPRASRSTSGSTSSLTSRRLYDRIEEYISQFYRKYEAQRKGLGFVMTVYRRRLTSSFPRGPAQPGTTP